MLTGANSAVGLRSMPICNLIADEVDGWPADADQEGDPLELARRRLANFARRKEFDISTPTIAGMSRIEKLYAQSDQRKYLVPCPFCGHYQEIKWESLRFDSKAAKPEQTVRMICESCAAEIYEYHKTEMLEKGKWVKFNPDSEIPGFHLSALYSPLGWYSWKKAVKEHLEALGDPMKRKVWVNTVLGELWDDAATTIDSHWLMSRAEKYPAEVPAGGLVLTAGVDTQDDRLEIKVDAWGLEFENWTIAHEVFMGDPGRLDVWGLLDQYLAREFKHENGQSMIIATTCIDAMGHHTDRVYEFCKQRFHRRVFAIQGKEGAGRPLIISYNKHKKKNVYLFQLGVDGGKATLYSRLKIKDPGPGYCHFPDTLSDRFYKQLTAEKRVMKQNQGIPKLRWVLPGGKRNEALDCAVYSMAALSILNPNLAIIAKQNSIFTGRPIPVAAKKKRRVLSQGV